MTKHDYQKAFAEGYEHQERLAQHFYKLGFEVETQPLPPFTEGVSYDQLNSFDIKLVGYMGKLYKNPHIIEVKSRPLAYSTFQYDTIIVDTCFGYDNKTPKPLAYVFLFLTDRTVKVLRSERVYPAWFKDKKYDTIRKQCDLDYMAPVSNLQSLKMLEDYLRMEAYESTKS
jgi:hypothetical protein